MSSIQSINSNLQSYHSSISKIVSQYLLKVIDFIVSIAHKCFKNIQLSLNDSFNNNSDSNKHIVLSHLKKHENLGSSVFTAFKESLEAEKNSFHMDTSFVIGSNYPKEKAEQTKIAIPVILKTSINHIVTFFYDKESQTLEYYDSKGLTIMDRKNTHLIFPLKDKEILTLNDLFIHLKEKYQPTSFKENIVREQKDIYNCGVFVLSYYLNKIQGHKESPKDSYLEQINKKRESIFYAIYPNKE